VNRTLRVWWDEENAPEKYEDVPLEDSDLWKVDDLMAFDKVVEHTYPGVSQPTEFRVRVELFLADQTGNCARVRRVNGRTPVGDGRWWWRFGLRHSPPVDARELHDGKLGLVEQPRQHERRQRQRRPYAPRRLRARSRSRHV